MINFDLKITDELFTKKAEELAEAIYGNRKEPLTNKNQIRNFYDKLLKYYDEVFIEKKDSEEVKPFVKMLISKVEYAKGRKVAKGEFVDFMKNGIGKINSKEDLKTFKLLFEAVIGYFVGLELDKKEKKNENY